MGGARIRVADSGIIMMNPFSWSREHQLALLVAALIGAALATVLGYIVYAVGWGEGAVPFENWILRLLRGPIWWALFGAVIGGASIFCLHPDTRIIRGYSTPCTHRPKQHIDRTLSSRPGPAQPFKERSRARA